MTTTAKVLVNTTQLTTGAATYYTTPASTTTVIRAATMCNTTGGAVTYTAHLVPSAGSVADNNMVAKEQSVAAGATVSMTELLGKVLTAGMTIRMLASAGASLTPDIAGMEIT